ncbi:MULTISPECIES: SE1561 family protein [Bhargavaea]|uniref:SE1561 family protein n=1 Tax=Bhargavaea changchunensis TaxID=2134037 RepID=A0ABW2NKM3_9BACL|nr:SE1561 family protein [Bhargavaea sp. CC-171006]
MEPTEHKQQVDLLKERLNDFLETLDHLEPETADLEEIDRLISMIDEIDAKVAQLRNSEN